MTKPKEELAISIRPMSDEELDMIKAYRDKRRRQQKRKRRRTKPTGN